MLLLNLDCTIWTGRAKLDEEDTPGAENYRPPKEIASAGGIKIIDPKTLDPFGKLKARAVRLLDGQGVKLMGGYLIDPGGLGDLEAALEKIKSEWNDEVTDFALAYERRCMEWRSAHMSWAPLIARKQPDPTDIAKKFRFAWQTFDCSPMPGTAIGNDTEAIVQELPNRALQQLCDQVYDLYAMSFANREPTGKAWGALSRLAQRCQALAFVTPDATRLAGMLETLAHDKNAQLARLTLSQMDSPQNVIDILDNGVSEPEPAPVLVLPEPEPLLAEAESLLQAPPAMPTFDSMGLF